MAETISSSQAAFIKGKKIFYAVLVANEVADECRKKKERLILKIDIEKAFDH